MLITDRSINYFLIPGLLTKKNLDSHIHKLTIDEVAQQVCNQFGVTVADIRVRCRKREFVEPRQLVCYICSKILLHNYKYVTIAKFFDISHCTIVHANRMVEILLQTDVRFQHKAILSLKSLGL